MSSYKVKYSYDGNHWIDYVDSTKNNTSRGYRVIGFVSVNKLFVRPDSYCVIFIVEIIYINVNVFSQLSNKKHSLFSISFSTGIPRKHGLQQSKETNLQTIYCG